MIRALYEWLTGTPWTTTRTASVEFGPAPAAIYQRELARYSDAELYARGPEILAALIAADRDESGRAVATPRTGTASGGRTRAKIRRKEIAR